MTGNYPYKQEFILFDRKPDNNSTLNVRAGSWELKSRPANTWLYQWCSCIWWPKATNLQSSDKYICIPKISSLSWLRCKNTWCRPVVFLSWKLAKLRKNGLPFSLLLMQWPMYYDAFYKKNHRESKTFLNKRLQKWLYLIDINTTFIVKFEICLW